MFEELLRNETADFTRDDAPPALLSQSEAIAVHRNADGDIVIRPSPPAGGEDSCIVIPRAEAENLIKAIRRELQAPAE